jgi:streptogramin lyase
MNGWEGWQDSFYVARFDPSTGSFDFAQDKLRAGSEGWTIYKSADSFPGAFMVGAVTLDGLVWGTVPEGGLASFDGQSWTFHTRADSLPLDNIRGLAVAPDDALWASTGSGVARLDGEGASDETWTTYTPDNGPASSIGSAIAFAPDGAIWFGTTRFQPTQAEGTLPTR